VHFYDPHDPYAPPPPFKIRYAASPYDGEIAYVDSAVGKLLMGLPVARSLRRALIAVVADHGEAFGEHGEQSHGLFLYDETLHVPLLIKQPSSRSPHVMVESRVGLVDLARRFCRTGDCPAGDDAGRIARDSDEDESWRSAGHSKNCRQ